MIVGSVLLLLTGVALLITGLIQGNDTYLVGTIIASLLAAVCLYGASRRTKARRAEAVRARSAQRAARRTNDAETDSRLRRREEADATAVVNPPRSREDKPAELDEHAVPTGGGRPTVDLDAETDVTPSDEPAEITMSSVEAAALMRMDAEVMVVDGRPRFHLGGCVHLVGRDAESLPAYEAVELGFGPCALCRPAQSLLREPTRR